MKMTREEALDRLKAALGDRLIAVHQKSSKRIYVEVAAEDVTKTSRLMMDELAARFQIATGVDTPTAIEVMYAAEWIEREMWELLGIRFRNHPDLRHLLLSDDWPEGKYPLRRDYRA
jgi:NADH:ubiquinone oxidoreductase subunit C